MKRLQRIAIAISVSVAIVLAYVVFHSLCLFVFLFSASVLRLGTATEADLLSLYNRYAAEIYLVGSLFFAAFVIGALLIYRKVKKSGFTNFLNPPKCARIFLFVLSTFVVGMTLNLAFSNLIEMLPLPQTWIDQNAESVGAFSESNLFAMLLAQGIAAPLAEELVFRGVIYHALRRAPILSNRRLCIGVCSVLVSAVFGWFHGNILQALYCFCFSLVLVLIVEKTGSLWGAVLAHMGFNSSWILMLLIQHLYRESAHLLNTAVFGLVSAMLVVLVLWSGGSKKFQHTSV